MAQALAKFAFLKVRDVWGAKSPEEERLVALIAELKGKLKLAPELPRRRRTTRSARRIRREATPESRTRKIRPTSAIKSKKRPGRRPLPRTASPRKRLARARPTIGASTTWPGEFIPPRTAALAMRGRREIKPPRRRTGPTQSPQQLPLPPSLAPRSPASSPTSRWTMGTNDSSKQHGRTFSW
jgi:hypothetical protein